MLRSPASPAVRPRRWAHQLVVPLARATDIPVAALVLIMGALWWTAQIQDGVSVSTGARGED